jgi:adenosylmethionine-8-amino-7-oxononanoate aminotransferase
MGQQPAGGQSWVARDAARVWHGFTQMAAYGANRPLIVERAEGRYLYDTEGRRYLDAISSLWVTTLGHRVPELDEALGAQAAKVAHTTMLGNGNRIVIELAESLAGRLPVEDARFLFASDGAAAVEQAVKIAFQYWHNLGVERPEFLALGDAYHGDTIGALSVGAGGFGTELFDPLRFTAVRRTPGYGDAEWLAKAREAIAQAGDRLAAVIAEPLVQGAAGMLVAEPADVAALSAACRQAGALLIFDEVATGFGRTGELFASEVCGARPDIMCIGKGIAGGYLPMSATVASGTVASAFLGEDLGPKTFYHGHSFGGNALAAAVALRHLELIDEWHVLDNVRARGEQLGALLAELSGGSARIAAIRRQGLMCGVELAGGDAARLARRACAHATENGVLLRSLGPVVVLMPILTTTAAEIEDIVDAVAKALAAVG